MRISHVALVVALCITVAGPALSAPVKCTWNDFLPAGHVPVPCMAPPRCETGTMSNISGLILDSGKGPMQFATEISVCYDDEYLHVTYTNANDKFEKNTYMECNTETWNQEVVEMFVAEGTDDPTEYTEIEITPKNVQYTATIHNPYKNGTDKSNTMIPCDKTGIIHTVTASPTDPHHTWIARVQVPWALVKQNEGPLTGSVWRINFFRVAMVKDVDICDAESCEFGCWSPTMRAVPAFHVTPYFGVVALL